MAINGRIFVDVAIQDTDGTASLKVVSLRSSNEYTTGKVAVVTGTCGTAGSSVVLNPTTFRDASGALVSFAHVSRIAFSATPAAYANHGDLASADSNLGSRAGVVSVAESVHDGTAPIDVFTTAGTASFTMVLYGT